MNDAHYLTWSGFQCHVHFVFSEIRQLKSGGVVSTGKRPLVVVLWLSRKESRLLVDECYFPFVVRDVSIQMVEE